MANTRTTVTISVYSVEFRSWKSHVVDRYDWNQALGFPVPNPDYHSKDPQAVRPDLNAIVVYHENAIRVQDANLAKPFSVKSTEWDVTYPDVIASARVDATRSVP